MHFLFKMGWNTIHVKMFRFQNIAKPSHKKMVRENLTWLFRARVPMQISILGSNSRVTFTTTFVLNKFMETIQSSSQTDLQVQYRQRWEWDDRDGFFFTKVSDQQWITILWVNWIFVAILNKRWFFTVRSQKQDKDIKIQNEDRRHLTLQSQNPQHFGHAFSCGQPTLAASFVNFGSAALAQLGESSRWLQFPSLGGEFTGKGPHGNDKKRLQSVGASQWTCSFDGCKLPYFSGSESKIWLENGSIIM